MTSKTWRYAALTGAIVVGLLGWAFAPRPLPVEVQVVKRGPFESGIEEDGRTRLLDRYTVSAPVSGRLGRIALREGDTVEPEGVIALLNPSLPPMLDRRTQSELRARLDTARAQVKRAQARIARAQVAVRESSQQLRRSELLRLRGFVAEAQIDNDRLADQAARQESRMAIEDLHVVQHEVDQAKAALAAVEEPGKAVAGAFAVRSPVGGRVLRVLEQSESVVQAGTPLLEIGDIGRMEVYADFLTTDAVRIKPGAMVHIGGWGGEKTLKGRARMVEPSAFTKVSALGVEEQRVKVLIDITSPPEQWRELGDGFRVAVRVITLSVADAVQAPVGAVFPLPAGEAGGPGGMGAFVVKDGRARLVPVAVAGRGERAMWIQHGLSSGDKVVMYPPVELRDGERVSERRP